MDASSSTQYYYDEGDDDNGVRTTTSSTTAAVLDPRDGVPSSGATGEGSSRAQGAATATTPPSLSLPNPAAAAATAAATKTTTAVAAETSTTTATNITTSATTIELGGSTATKRPAFCLLDGMQDDEDVGAVVDNKGSSGGSSRSRVTFPIFRLPATLGRTLDSNMDWNFIGMGSFKFLSRQHVKIQWLIPTTAGGCGQMQSKVQKAGDNFYFNLDDPITTSEIIQTGDSPQHLLLPESGFFAITCLGKNRILVNGTRLEQGQTGWLEPGAAVRIGGLALYFLTPVDAAPTNTAMEVRDDVPPAQATTKRRRISLGGGNVSVSTTMKKPQLAGSGGGPDKKPNLVVSSATMASTNAAAGYKKGQSLQSELDKLPTKELLKQMNQGIKDNVWDRRHQLIGSTLSYRAVLSAARSPAVQRAAVQNRGELARSEIMDWISESERFRGWVEHMLSKMEPKSYQSSITRALIKAGFQRNSAHGRYIKWRCPKDIYTPPEQSEEDESAKEEENGDGTRASDDEPDNDDEEDGGGLAEGGDGDNEEGDRQQYHSGEEQDCNNNAAGEERDDEDENSLLNDEDNGMLSMDDDDV